MTEADVFARTGDAYLRLIHPVMADDRYREDVAPVLALAPAVPDELVAAMLVGASWRERLLGLCLAMALRPGAFIERVLQSLREPRGIAIVPACAVLGVLARRGVFAMHPSLAYDFDRAAFDGEIAWGLEKALAYAGLPALEATGQASHSERSEEPHAAARDTLGCAQGDMPTDRGPNYGQIFEDHAAVYAWVHDRAAKA
jgi:hypothetical protein